MAQYLYGASVQGIQDFIFNTNKLTEIVGGSALVENICTKEFYKIAKILDQDSNTILAAAGNIKHLFSEEEHCKEVVLNFPKKVMELAPGITINQAVVKLENPNELPSALQTLEDKLRVQRNIVSSPNEISFMGMQRSRRTGGAAVDLNNGEYIDEATKIKRKENKRELLFKKLSGLENIAQKNLPYDISNITKSGKNSWIAVVHADGNGLGNILQNQGENLTVHNEFNRFSRAIESATIAAAQSAFNKVIPELNYPDSHYPIQPIVIGGDDLTFIVRADLALDFTSCFLEEFEKESKRSFEGFRTSGLEKGLTACAGIAYIKNSYPLHYGLDLAEALCKDAKKMVKREIQNNENPKSALAFYKVQDSFVRDLETLKSETLKTKSGLSFYYGPYTLDMVADLNLKLKVLKEYANDSNGNKSIGKLRQLISELYRGQSSALLMLNRIKQINGKFYKDLDLVNSINQQKTLLLDLITLHGFHYGNN